MASENNQTARGIFRKVVKGTNVMTPKILAYEYAGDYVVELSEGESVGGQKMWGVTVVNPKKKEHCFDLCRCFYNRKEARKYINQLAQL